MPSPDYAPRSGVATLAIVVTTVLILLVGWTLPLGWNYLAIVALMGVSVFVLGQTIVGRPFGILISEMNLMSLSRFQMVVWTIVVLGAYFAYALARMKAGYATYPDPLAVQIDWRLWALMGISTTTLVGSAVISSAKRDKTPDPETTKFTAESLGEDEAKVRANSEGLLYANEAKADARFTDIFQGDEVGDTAHIDLAKVQMFYFTVISALAFIVMIARSLHDSHIDALPVLPDGLIGILGISHAGYLTGKSVSKTPARPPAAK